MTSKKVLSPQSSPKAAKRGADSPRKADNGNEERNQVISSAFDAGKAVVQRADGSPTASSAHNSQGSRKLDGASASPRPEHGVPADVTHFLAGVGTVGGATGGVAHTLKGSSEAADSSAGGSNTDGVDGGAVLKQLIAAGANTARSLAAAVGRGGSAGSGNMFDSSAVGVNTVGFAPADEFWSSFSAVRLTICSNETLPTYFGHQRIKLQKDYFSNYEEIGASGQTALLLYNVDSDEIFGVWSAVDNDAQYITWQVARRLPAMTRDAFHASPAAGIFPELPPTDTSVKAVGEDARRVIRTLVEHGAPPSGAGSSSASPAGVATPGPLVKATTTPGAGAASSAPGAGGTGSAPASSAPSSQGVGARTSPGPGNKAVTFPAAFGTSAGNAGAVVQVAATTTLVPLELPTTVVAAPVASPKSGGPAAGSSAAQVSHPVLAPTPLMRVMAPQLRAASPPIAATTTTTTAVATTIVAASGAAPVVMASQGAAAPSVVIAAPAAASAVVHAAPLVGAPPPPAGAPPPPPSYLPPFLRFQQQFRGGPPAGRPAAGAAGQPPVPAPQTPPPAAAPPPAVQPTVQLPPAAHTNASAGAAPAAAAAPRAGVQVHVGPHPTPVLAARPAAAVAAAGPAPATAPPPGVNASILHSGGAAVRPPSFLASVRPPVFPQGSSQPQPMVRPMQAASAGAQVAARPAAPGPVPITTGGQPVSRPAIHTPAPNAPAPLSFAAASSPAAAAAAGAVVPPSQSPVPAEAPPSEAPPPRSTLTCPLCQQRTGCWFLVACTHMGPCEECCPTDEQVRASYPKCVRCDKPVKKVIRARVS